MRSTLGCERGVVELFSRSDAEDRVVQELVRDILEVNCDAGCNDYGQHRLSSNNA